MTGASIPIFIRDVSFYTYILASRKQGTLYIGVTNDVARRAWEHRESEVPGFTKRYSIKRLVYVETHDSAENAIKREKRLKKWPRAWKVALIERDNPEWFDLYRRINL